MIDYMNYRRIDNMKNLLLLIVLLLSTQAFSQQWITDENFDDKIYKNEQCIDCIVVVEFYADFNKDNAFKEWAQLKGVKYFRANIPDVPNAKKEYRVRMAPTIIIFKDGLKEDSFKAKLDLLCPVTLKKLNSTIEEIKTADRF
jgi:hypothetical protein|tara:strand:+ start:384 stop:812 length:429 start_codon:yes stop_codon:yes gene_type:complete